MNIISANDVTGFLKLAIDEINFQESVLKGKRVTDATTCNINTHRIRAHATERTK